MKLPIRGEPFIRSLSGTIQSVLVAEWPDEIRLWRVGVDGQSQIRTFRFSVGFSYKPGNLWLEESTRSFKFVLPHPDDVETIPMLRWVGVELGIVQAGTAPWPSSEVDASQLNPWVGRFVGRTMEEVQKAAKAFDYRLLEEHFRRMLEQQKDYMAMLVPFTANEGRDPDPYRLHYPIGWMDQPVMSRGSIVFEFDLSEEESPSDVEGLKPYVIDVSRISGRGGSTSVARIRRHSLVEALPHLSDFSKHPTWAILPQGDADRWWEENTMPGRLALSEGEVEVFRMLGEELPFVWPNDRLLAWAGERWPEGNT